MIHCAAHVYCFPRALVVILDSEALGKSVVFAGNVGLISLAAISQLWRTSFGLIKPPLPVYLG